MIEDIEHLHFAFQDVHVLVLLHLAARLVAGCLLRGLGHLRLVHVALHVETEYQFGP